MENDLKKLLSNQFTVIACAAIFIIYLLQAYRIVPSDEQHRFHVWLKENRTRVVEGAVSPDIRFSVRVESEHGPIEWNVADNTDDPEHTVKILRLLELAATSQLFSFADNGTDEVSQVTLDLEGESFSATISRQRLEASPALQTLLRLSKVYAVNNSINTKEVAHANP